MDTTAASITFDERGICNYCIDLEFAEDGHNKIKTPSKILTLDERIASIKKASSHQQYNCIVGVSGGVDSSWTLVRAVQLGLRPLAVHFDNGWNSELAQSNIENLVKTLEVDLFTHVVDWSEYRGLMNSFFDADVVDIELLYDNAMQAVNYHQANKLGIKSILGGFNKSTEGLRIPPNWNWYKFDEKNIRAINKNFGGPIIKTLPTINSSKHFWLQSIRRYRWHSLLDLEPYNKNEVIDHLSRDFKYKSYPYKHYESIFTRFYQGYILPKKFGIDKRRVHFSSLIMSNQMSRSDALNELSKSPYPSHLDLESDLSYFLKKMNWSKEKLDIYLLRPRREHDEFPSERYFAEKFYKKFNNLKKHLLKLSE
jgi:N-acetyl sugar amidotransferase